MKKLRIFTILFCLLTLVSCDSVDFGDINQDDDAPQEANMEGLMAGGMNQYFTTGSTVPTLYVQYQTQSVYTSAMRYGLNPAPWDHYYSGVLTNFKQVYETTTADKISKEVKTYGEPANQAAVAELMSVVVWKRVTDTWGPVPYEEALDAQNNKTPSYSDQKKIYKDLIKRAKAARDMIDPSKSGPTGDVLYGGNMSHWQKFANSLLLELSMQLSNKYPGASDYAATEFKKALNNSAGVIDEISEEAWYDFQNSPGALNPFSELRGSDFYLAEPFTDALMGKTPQDSAIVYSNTNYDGRLQVLSTDSAANGAPYGVDNSGLSGPSIAGAITSAGSDLHYMTAAYTYLNRAEAAELGWTSEDASTMLRKGIMMSYATFDGHYDDKNANDANAEVSQPDFDSGELQSDGSNYATQRVAQATNPNNNVSMRQVISEEKWVALFPMGFKAWSEWRRSSNVKTWSMSNSTGPAIGYPGLYPAPDATNKGEIPHRYLYPSVESGVNTESYNAGVDRLKPAEDVNSSEFWWDQQ